VKTQGWTPVDARVHVSDVPSLIAQIGGAQLYRKDPSVPLRELIQNAADAVRARRALSGMREGCCGRVTG
jgi:HSP90 family molecular chaperone